MSTKPWSHGCRALWLKLIQWGSFTARLYLVGLLSCHSKAESCLLIADVHLFAWNCNCFRLLVPSFISKVYVSPCFTLFCEGFPSPASLRIPGDDLALTTKVGCWHVWLCRRARIDHSRCRRKTTRLHLLVGPKYPKLWAKQFEVVLELEREIGYLFLLVDLYNSLSCFELLYRMAKS